MDLGSDSENEFSSDSSGSGGKTNMPTQQKHPLPLEKKHADSVGDNIYY